MTWAGLSTADSSWVFFRATWALSHGWFVACHPCAKKAMLICTSSIKEKLVTLLGSSVQRFFTLHSFNRIKMHQLSSFGHVSHRFTSIMTPLIFKAWWRTTGPTFSTIWSPEYLPMLSRRSTTQVWQNYVSTNFSLCQPAMAAMGFSRFGVSSSAIFQDSVGTCHAGVAEMLLHPDGCQELENSIQEGFSSAVHIACGYN